MAKASCPQCKAKTASSAHVCPACGFPLTPPQPLRSRQWPPKKKNNMNGFSKALLLIGGMFAALLFLSD